MTVKEATKTVTKALRTGLIGRRNASRSITDGCIGDYKRIKATNHYNFYFKESILYGPPIPFEADARGALNATQMYMLCGIKCPV